MNRILPFAEKGFEQIVNAAPAACRACPEHGAVIAEIRRIGLDALSPEEQGEADCYLQMAVREMAEKTGAYIYKTGQDSGGRPFRHRVIDEEKFPEEIGLLHEISERNRYSSALEGWLAEKRHAFVDEIKADPRLMAGIEQWPAMTLDARGELLKTLIRRRLESFSDKNFLFAAPDIEIVDDDKDLSASSGSASSRRNRIKLQKSLLEHQSPDFPLMTAHHEGTHNILTQLAMAADEGRISSSHPLFSDIQTAHFSRDKGLGAPPDIESLYNSDDEERLCNEEQEFFLTNLRRGYGLRQKFDVVRFAAKQYLTAQNSLTLKQLIHELRCG